VGDEFSDWEGLEERRDNLERKVSRWSQDKAVVDDVVQETLIRAARYRVGLREPQRMDSWMERIAWNVLKSQRSREARRGVAVVENGLLDGNEGREPDPEIQFVENVHWVRDEEVEKDRLAALLEAAIRALPDHERCLIRAAYSGQMSPCEISAAFGVRREVVKSRLYRIRRKLRRRVVQALEQSWR
jgi:RNA polymerase sigma factor (sigma-70 family)